MPTLEDIYQQIIDDPMNESYTKKDIMPLYSAPQAAKIVIVGQAPGIHAQESQQYWNDASGVKLREWLGVSDEEFYESDDFAILPMDFYYPGKAKTGDKAPRREFANKYHPLLLKHLPNVELIILAGQYAQRYYLGKERRRNLTETVRHYRDYLPKYFPIVHPSPLNFRWQSKNPWFEKDVVPVLTSMVQDILSD